MRVSRECLASLSRVSRESLASVSRVSRECLASDTRVPFNLLVDGTVLKLFVIRAERLWTFQHDDYCNHDYRLYHDYAKKIPFEGDLHTPCSHKVMVDRSHA